ncbi:MAG: fibronectin type III-like domain-contianing protein [Clostridiales bacterium]|nr:fibronectin type III-like domain-contianing protein [Clostridiales bacterium]
MGHISGYDDEINAPLFPFGYGLSYTQFAYSDLRISADTMARGGSLTASVRVANTGERDGAEVVQWYIRDKFASVVRPIKELKGFERVFLKAGEVRSVQFTVTEEMLKFYTASGEFKAESGEFTLFVGGNCRDTLCADFFLKDLSDFDLPVYDMAKYLQYYWDGELVYNESAMLVKNKDGSLDDVTLLYPIDKIVSVRSADLTTLYKEGADYKVENGKLIVLDGGSIPVMAYDDMYFDTKPEAGAIGVSDGNGYFSTVDGTYEKYEEAGILYEHQIAVTYFHKGKGNYTVPPTQSEKFKLFLGKLAKGAHVNIAVLGDSISDGCNASGFFKKKLKPCMPTYFGMLGDYIKAKYAHADVQTVNYSVGGKNSHWGVTQTDRVAALSPDLVILGFGMNDGSSYIDEEAYYENMLQMVDGIRKGSPDCAFVVLGTMLPNEKICWKEGGLSIRGNQEKYMAALRRLAKERTGVAVADITTLHKEYLQVKKHRDMTGNNVNHPNDFLVRLYAQTIIKTIFG